MSKWEGSGKTVEEAIENALKEMGASRDEVEVKIIDAPSVGFLGFGKKMAKVQVSPATPDENPLSGFSISLDSDAEENVPGEKEALNEIRSMKSKEESFTSRKVEITEEAMTTVVRFVEEVAYRMGAEVEIHPEKREEEIFISILGDKNGILIGKHGKTLDALQYLTGLAVHKVMEGRVRVVLDVEGYRERRKNTLENLAVRYANQAVERGSKVVLEPMNPQERRLIHMALQEDERIRTESEGEEPFRRVVIFPKKLTNDFVIYVEKFQRRDRNQDRSFGNRGGRRRY